MLGFFLPDCGSNQQPTLTRIAHTNHYTPDAVYYFIFNLNLLRIIVNIYPIYLKEVFEDAKSVNGRTDNTIAQILKGQTTIYNTLHRKQSILK